MPNVPALRTDLPDTIDGNQELIPPPQPGSYHRLTHEYDVWNDSEKRRRHEYLLEQYQKHIAWKAQKTAEDPDFVYEPNIHAPGHPGEYTTPAPVAGNVLLVSKVNEVDGEFHSAVVERHPVLDLGGINVNASKFRSWFEPAPDWQEVRTRELAEAQSRLNTAQADMAAGPSRDEVDPEPEAPRVALPRGSASSFAIVIQNGGREGIERAAARNIAIAKNTESWLVQKSALIVETIGYIAAFHKENAVFQIAKTQKIQEEVKRLTRGVESLGIYSGDNVEIVTFATGQSAPPDVPLVLFQRKLYMDEEYLINLALHGADWQNNEAFLERVRNDEELRKILLPFPRGIVLFRVRRNDVDYASNLKGVDEMARFLVNEQKNTPNRAHFLLVRDGENLHQVWLPELLNQGAPERLFPQTDELNKPFRGYDGTEMTFDDLSYHKAAEISEDAGLFYRRLLIMIWGLQDSKNLFGTFYDPTKYPTTGFMSLEFQHEHMLFISDDDVHAIGDERPQWKTWIPKMNSYLRHGSHVLCDWKELVNYETAPHAMREGTQSFEYYPKYNYPERYGISTCRINSDGDAIVKAKVNRYSGPDFETEIYINRLQDTSGVNHYGGVKFLVLDAVTAEDIESILRSRSQRAEYLQYVPLLMRARDAVLEQTNLSEDCRRILVADLAKAGIGSDLEREKIALDAVRLWRGDHSGRAPSTTGRDAAKTRKTLARIAYRLQHPNLALDDVKNAIVAEHRNPLAIVIRGDGNLHVYASEPTNARPHLLPWRWVSRSIATFEKESTVSLSEWTTDVLPVADAGERMLWESSSASPLRSQAFSHHSDRHSHDPSLSLERASKIEEALMTGPDLLRSYRDGTVDVRSVLSGIGRKNKWSTRHRHRYLDKTPSLAVAIGIVTSQSPYEDPKKDSRFFTDQKWDQKNAAKQAEALRRAQEKADKRLHLVLMFEWNPTAALSLHEDLADIARKYWNQTLDVGSLTYDKECAEKPRLRCYDLLSAPIAEDGLTTTSFYDLSGVEMGPSNLDGNVFDFDLLFRGSGGCRPNQIGQSFHVDEDILKWLKEVVEPVDMTPRNKKYKK